MQINTRLETSLPFVDAAEWNYPPYPQKSGQPMASTLYRINDECVAAIRALRETQDSVLITYDMRPGWYQSCVNTVARQILEEQAGALCIIASKQTLPGAAAAARTGAAVGVFAGALPAFTLRLAFNHNAWLRFTWSRTLEPESKWKELYRVARRLFRSGKLDTSNFVRDVKGDEKSRMVSARMLRDEGLQQRYPWLSNGDLEHLASLASADCLHAQSDPTWNGNSDCAKYNDVLLTTPGLRDLLNWFYPPASRAALPGHELHYWRG